MVKDGLPLDPWENIRRGIAAETGSGAPVVDPGAKAGQSGKLHEVEPLCRIWHVGESRFNGRDGQPLQVACMLNTRTGKETPVLYSRAYGLENLVHAHGARLVDRPEGWRLEVYNGILAAGG